MKRPKPISLKKMDPGHKTMLIVSIVICSMLLIFGWASTVGGMFKKDVGSTRESLAESIKLLGQTEEQLNVKDDAKKIKGYFTKGIDSIQKRQTAQDAIINNVKEDIENN
jgi:hypothetical protein